MMAMEIWRERASARTQYTWGSRVNCPINASSSSKLRPWLWRGSARPGTKPRSSALDKSAEIFPTRLHGCTCAAPPGSLLRDAYTGSSFLHSPTPSSPKHLRCRWRCISFYHIPTRCVVHVVKNSCRQVRFIRRERTFSSRSFYPPSSYIHSNVSAPFLTSPFPFTFIPRTTGTFDSALVGRSTPPPPSVVTKYPHSTCLGDFFLPASRLF